MMTLAIGGPVVAIAQVPSCSPVERQFHAGYPLSTSGRLQLKNLRGAVYINGTNQTQVEVDATESACSQSDLDSIQILAQSRPPNRERPDVLEIETRHRRQGAAISVEYHISVPRNIRLDRIAVEQGNLTISGVNGQIHARSGAGDVVVKGVAAPSHISSGRGSVQVDFARLSGGDRLSTKGELTVTLPSDTSADITATTGSREINNEFGVPATATSRGHSLTFRIGRGAAFMQLTAFGGSISILRANDDKPLNEVVNLERELPRPWID
ncbi:MAG TPA: hypothetical protein VEV41_12275 [Terriglobales bacterium]|nr:hypothetical protein [Terriglobales bacterium]